jgi:hypothetical protein
MIPSHTPFHTSPKATPTVITYGGNVMKGKQNNLNLLYGTTTLEIDADETEDIEDSDEDEENKTD